MQFRAVQYSSVLGKRRCIFVCIFDQIQFFLLYSKTPAGFAALEHGKTARSHGPTVSRPTPGHGAAGGGLPPVQPGAGGRGDAGGGAALRRRRLPQGRRRGVLLGRPPGRDHGFTSQWSPPPGFAGVDELNLWP